MAADKSDPGKRTYRNVLATPGRENASPARKQRKGEHNDANNKELDGQEQRIATIINDMLDSKLETLAARLENMMSEKIKALEHKFQNLEKEITVLKEDYNESLDHVERNLRAQIDDTWDYAVRNEQYSRKNNLRILGIEEEEEENLEGKFIQFVQENLQEEIRSDEIEIIHRIGGRKKSDEVQDSRRDRKPRPVIVKLQSNKTKMKILVKRRLLKGKGFVIFEDMADDIAKRLKDLNKKKSVESSWFSNGKIKYKQRGDPRVKEIRSWSDLGDIE